MPPDLGDEAIPLPPVVVISLPEEVVRRARMAERLAAQGMAFSFFDAVDGRGFDVARHPAHARRRRRLWFGKDLTGGEIGCLLSHRTVLEGVAAGKSPVVVLEDDAVLQPEFRQVVLALMARRPQWDLVRFLNEPKIARMTQRTVIDLGRTYRVVRIMSWPSRAHAYIVTPRGARKLLKRLHRSPFPVDVVMNQTAWTGLPNLVAQPGIAAQDETLDSAIGDGRFDRTRRQPMPLRLVFPLTHAAFKLTAAIVKRWSYLASWPADTARLRRSRQVRRNASSG